MNSKTAKVNLDYHVEVEGHYYSVPYQLAHKKVQIRWGEKTVEVLYAGKRVASHKRSAKKWDHTTNKDHMPESHREHAKWTPERIISWAKNSGENTGQVAEAIMDKKPHPQQAFRSILGLIRLGEKFGHDRLEGACRRALNIHSPSYKSVKSILNCALDKRPLEEPAPEAAVVDHRNIRGSAYYTHNHSKEKGPC